MKSGRVEGMGEKQRERRRRGSRLGGVKRYSGRLYN